MFRDVSASTNNGLYAPRTVAVVGVMLHTTNGISSLAWLQRGSFVYGKPASADFLISRNGDVYRIVARGSYAFHAGESVYNGHRDDAVSARFIGIEMENNDAAQEAPTQAQYDALGGVLTELLKSGEIPRNYAIVAHGGVAIPLGRRSDPFNFDYGRIIWPR